MTEQLISLETAKLAKEKGFNWKCRYYYSNSGFLYSEMYEVFADYNNKIMLYEAFSAPTQSLLQKWLREVHNIFVEPYRIDSETFFRIHNFKNLEWRILIDNFKPCGKPTTIKEEEALEEGLLEALKLL